MRSNLKNEGYMTVEATVVVTLLIVSLTLMTYMSIYIYDRTMLMQDTYSMAVYARESLALGEEEMMATMGRKFAEIKDERPYLSFRNVDMNLSKKHSEITISSRGDFYTPFGGDSLFGNKDREIAFEKSVKPANPIEIMLKVRTLEDNIHDYIQH